MNPKTKAKIEAMADEKEQYCWCAGPACSGCAGNAVKLIYDGATPWAEWCERFEKHIEKMIHENYGACIEDIVILKEYRTWLEGGGE